MANKHNSMLFLGDSIFGWPDNFVGKFEAANPSVTVTNLNLAGASYGAPVGNQSFLSIFQAAAPSAVEAVVIGTGINAINPMSSQALTSPIPASETIDEVIALVDAIKDSMPFAEIYFMKPLPVDRSGASAMFYDSILDAAIQNLDKVLAYQAVNFSIIDLQKELGMGGAVSSNPYYDVNTSLLESDGLHPNAAGHDVLADAFTDYFSAPSAPNADDQVNLDNYKAYWATGSIASGRDWGTRRLNSDGEIMGNYVHTEFPEYD